MLKPSPPLVFDAAKDFTRDVVPVGAWRYGWMAENGDTFHVYGRVRQNAAPQAEGILNLCRPEGGCPAIGTNTTAVVQHSNGTSTLLPGQLELHPGPGGEYSVASWMAPTAGAIRIEGGFTGLSGYHGAPATTTEVLIFHGAEIIFNSALNLKGKGNVASFDLTRKVKKGETVLFAVGPGNSCNAYDSTALDARIVLRE